MRTETGYKEEANVKKIGANSRTRGVTLSLSIKFLAIARTEG